MSFVFQNNEAADLEKGAEDGSNQSIHTDRSSKHIREKSRISSPIARDDIEESAGVIHKTTSRLSSKIVRVATRASTVASWVDHAPPPDGGLHAWTQVVMGHLVIMNTWGFINSFGVFQDYYTTTLDISPSAISWIGSIQIFLGFFIGILTGRLTDGGSFRHVMLVGSVALVLGIFMASLSTQYYQLFLAHGMLCGLGIGCLFCPTLSLCATYFSRNRSMALGLVGSGTATGGLVFPAIVQQLLPRVGYPWTMRAVGLVVVLLLGISNVFLRPRLPPRHAGAVVDWKAFRDWDYTLFTIGMFFTFWGLYFAFFFLGSYARSVVGLPYSQTVNLILVLNGVGYLGRLVPGYLADRYCGPVNLMVPVTLGAAVTMYAMMSVRSEAGLFAWTAVYGHGGAAIQSLFPTVLGCLTKDLTMVGVRMGMAFTIVSFAVLTGPPIAGHLITLDNNGTYCLGVLFSATSMLVGAVLIAGARFSRSGLVWRYKI